MINRVLRRLFMKKRLEEFHRLNPVAPLNIQDMDAWNRRYQIGVQAQPVPLTDKELLDLVEALQRGAFFVESNDHNTYFTDTNRVFLQIEEPITEETIRQYKGKVMTAIAIRVQIKRDREEELLNIGRAIMNRVVSRD